MTTPASHRERSGPAAFAPAADQPAVTNADPLLTRLALGRSSDGSQFGMFLQVFTDGTVIDSEGVHRLRSADLKPIMDLVQSGELYRDAGPLRCAGDGFHRVCERRGLRAPAGSADGALVLVFRAIPQGCDHAIRHLHTTLENMQVKFSRTPGGSQPPAGCPGSPASARPGDRRRDGAGHRPSAARRRR